MNNRKLISQSILVVLLTAICIAVEADARPVTSAKGGNPTPQRFIRQRNTMSNMDFFFTNKGVLFNYDNSAGLNWPRGTNQSYIFGGGVWFATQKSIGGKRRKLCELGYNPNSGAGWYSEGEINGAPDNADYDSKYISYVSTRYSKTDGKYDGIPRTSVTGSYSWPIWDTAQNKTLNKNYYFGDYISDVNERVPKQNGTKLTKPAMLSQEDIVNIYTDNDVSYNPEYRPNTGYPFGLNIVEIIHSWSFGRYRDMIFVRHKITNASNETLYDCFMAPAFDPDLGTGSAAAGNDRNQYVDVGDIDKTQRALKGTCFENDPRRLNMAFQSSNPEGGKEYGMIGFAFLQSPVVNNQGEVLDITDSASVGGYGLVGSVPQLGLNTFKKWTINNDPPTPELRYDFTSDGSRDGDGNIVGDMRLLFSTGKFTLPPGKSAETCVAIAIAQASTTDRNRNIDSLLRLIAFAHEVYGGDCFIKYDSVKNADDEWVKTSQVTHFITPVPPDIPNMRATSLDRAVYLQWDSTADFSTDPLSQKTLAFNTYELYRSTRSDLDSTIRPDGKNPVVKLGTWSIYDLQVDSVFNAQKQFVRIQYKRKNSTPNKIPHSFLDIGDDNKDGIIASNEGLLNGVKYYYYLLATDEFDSVNNVGPLTTSIVQGKNLVTVMPAKPVFPDLPNTIGMTKECFSGENQSVDPKVLGINNLRLEVVDTGKFVELYTNDEIKVSFQPRWREYTQRYISQSPLYMNVNVTDTKTGLDLTYDRLYNPSAVPAITPYEFNTGLVHSIVGQNADSSVKGVFTTDNNNFTPYQRINQAFRVLTDFEFTQLNAPYKLSKFTFESTNKGNNKILRLSRRTLPGNTSLPAADYSDLGDRTNPSFLGSLGEVTYVIEFGDAEDMAEQEYDTTTKSYYWLSGIKDPNSNTEFKPRPLRVTVRSVTHCNEPLTLMRDINVKDYTQEFDHRYYVLKTQPATQPGFFYPNYTDPDTMLVPNPGYFAIDAYHYSDDDPVNHGAAQFIQKTTGNYYYSGITRSGNKYLATVHRLRLAGAEIILNYPAISDPGTTGDTTIDDSQFSTDFQPGDKIYVNFTGHVRGLPMPNSQFTIKTSPDKQVNFNDPSLYAQQEILDQIQVVPNPYIVTHLGQSSTDNAKIYFTRLPPRATIEIYTLDGDLVKTIEHRGYKDISTNPATPQYDYSQLAGRYNVAEWNMLSEGRQRIGSQVLFARVLAKDPNTDAVVGETTVKFAVVIGGYRR